MRNKKGFTLIELLAVIVILAVIALITVPVVINIINNAKKGAAEDSAYGVIEAAKLYWVENSLEDTNNVVTFTYDGDNSKWITIGDKELLISGTKPTGDNNSSIIVSGGNVSLTNVKFNGFTCNTNNEYKVECESGSGSNQVTTSATKYTVNVTCNNCTSDVASKEVEEGSSVTFTLTADANYTLEGATVEGCSLNGTTLSMDNVTSDTTCTVSAVSNVELFTNVDLKYYKYEGKTFIGTGVDNVIITKDITENRNWNTAKTKASAYCTNCRLMTRAELCSWRGSSSSTCSGQTDNYSKTIANYNGSASLWWLADAYDSNYAWSVGNSGRVSDSFMTGTYGVRPAVSIPASATIPLGCTGTSAETACVITLH